MHSADRQLGSITEFGVPLNEYRTVLHDLHKRAELRRDKGHPMDRMLVASLGETDLLEVSFFKELSNLFEVSGSSVHAFRRSLGVAADISTDAIITEQSKDWCLAPLDTVMGHDPKRPFVSIHYLRLSTLVVACTPPLGGAETDPQEQSSRTLARKWIRSLGTSDLWTTYESELDACDLGADRGDLPPLLVSPVTGLDTVDVVLLVRARRLEQIAVLSWVLRSCTVAGAHLDSPDQSALGSRLERLLQVTRSESDRWPSSPTISHSTTLVGLWLDPEAAIADDLDTVALYGASNDWTPDDLAAESASFTRRHRVYNTRAMARFASATKERRAAVLFGRADILYPASGAASTLTIGAVIEIFDAPLRAKIDQRMPGPGPDQVTLRDTPVKKVLDAQADVVTEIAIHLPIGAGTDGHPDTGFERRLAQRLTESRKFHIERDPDEGAPKGWLRRWLDASKKIGLAYPLTNGMVNLIPSVLNYLEQDPASYVDLLPLLAAIVRMAEDIADRQMTPRRLENRPVATIQELREAYRAASELMASRARRDDPLRPPRGTIAFEAHAGYRSYRDAFLVFTDAIRRELNIDHPTVVLDSAGGGFSVRTLTSGPIILTVSSMVLHHPFHWSTYVHEMGHALFATCSLEEWEASVCPERPPLPAGERDAWTSIRMDFAESNRQVAGSLQRFGFPSAELLSACFLQLEEVAADVIVAQLIGQPGDPEETLRRFWFVHGPSLIFERQRTQGYWQNGQFGILVELIMRAFTVNRTLLSLPLTYRSFLDDLVAFVDHLRREGHASLKLARSRAGYGEELPLGEASRPNMRAVTQNHSTRSKLLGMSRQIAHNLVIDVAMSANNQRRDVENIWLDICRLIGGLESKLWDLEGDLESEEIFDNLFDHMESTIYLARRALGAGGASQASVSTLAPVVNAYRQHLLRFREIRSSSDSRRWWLRYEDSSMLTRLKPRGGLKVPEGAPDVYTQATWQLMHRLCEEGRTLRFDILAEYLDASPPAEASTH